MGINSHLRFSRLSVRNRRLYPTGKIGFDDHALDGIHIKADARLVRFIPWGNGLSSIWGTATGLVHQAAASNDEDGLKLEQARNQPSTTPKAG